MSSALVLKRNAPPALGAILELLKPITWFPPMWAFGCGIVSAGAPLADHWLEIAIGIALAGPFVCAASQAVNDWFDRHVDAINEPNRPIPSGRLPGRWGLYVALVWTALSALVGAMLGPWVLGATCLGLVLAWAYSAPPLRLKRNGWWGNSAVAACYEGLPWVTGAVVAGAVMPQWPIVALAALYSAGAHGIMTLNDFKSVDGDRRMGVSSLPVLLGVTRAARVACVFMIVPQLAVTGLLLLWGHTAHAASVALLVLMQLLLMRRLLAQPRERAAWYSATGVSLYVIGMLVSAFALRAAHAA